MSAVVASGAPYQLDRDQLVLRGRWRAYAFTLAVAAFLLALQTPPRMVATGTWPSVQELSATVPARLSLLVDTVMIAAYFILARRALELVRFAPGRTTRQWRFALLAMWLVAAGAALDVVENCVLWVRTGSPGERAVATLEWLPWTPLMRLLVAGGLVLGLAVAARAARHTGPRVPPTELAAPMAGGRQPQGSSGGNSGDQPELVVCCSGGGIRAAAFSMGGLQALKHRYQRADAVIGVSGGGYMAAAYHVHRWKTTDKDGEWADAGRVAYAPGSAEERWLRGHSRYLIDSPRAGIFGLLSLLFGLAVNLLFITALLGATAWVAGWFLLASGGMTGWKGDEAKANQYEGDWSWVQWAWVPLAAGIALFVVAKVIDKVIGSGGMVGREQLRSTIVALVTIGIGLTVALIGLPALLEWLHNFAHTEHTNVVAKAFSDLLGTLGFGPAEAPSSGETKDGASGAAVSTTSLAAIAAAVIATIRAIGSSLTQEGAGSKESAAGKLVTRVWAKVKHVVLPWAAAVLVVTLLLAVFLAWTAGLLNDPADLERWSLALVYGGLVLATALLTDANRTSLHHFYRERLSSAYLVGQDKNGVPGQLNYREALRFSAAAPVRGGPALVTCAVANVTDLNLVPTGRDCTPFVFSHDRIGLTEETLPDTAMVAATDYEFAADSRGRDATIPAAVAISGAAFSPLAGRENAKIGPYRLLLALANARLGVWLPNPLWVDPLDVARRRERAYGDPEAAKTGSRGWKLLEAAKDVVTKPTPFLVAREAFGRTSVLDRFLYVTDGGHYDNLGLVEALRRRPRTVLVLDASNDDEDSFATLGQAIATARTDLGCEVDIDPRSMRRLKDGRPSAAFVHGHVTYRDHGDNQGPMTGELWVAKAVMLDGLSWDVETYAGAHTDFPRTSTGDQLYGEFDLEAYRALGAAVVVQLLANAEKNRAPSPLKGDWP